MTILGNLSPVEVAAAAFLHIPVKPVKQAMSKIKPLKILGVTLPYFVVKSVIESVSHYQWRESKRSISGLCCDVFFRESGPAYAFAKEWVGRLPKECNGVLIRREQGEFKVSIPCCTLERV